MVDELPFGRVGAVAQDHPGDHALAEIVIGLAGDRGVIDRRMLAQRPLDLAGADLVAP